MQERQEFLDRYFVFTEEHDYKPPHDYTRTNGLVEDIRQRPTAPSRSSERLDEITRPKEVQGHDPGEPLELAARCAPRAGRRPTTPTAAPTSDGARPERNITVNLPGIATTWSASRSEPCASSASSERSSRVAAPCRADALERLYAVQREKRRRPHRSRSSTSSSSDELADRARARRGGAAPARRAARPGADPERARRRAYPSRSRRPTGSSSCAEDDHAVHVSCADPFDTAPLDDLRLLFGKPVEVHRRARREDRRRHQPRLRARGRRRRARDRAGEVNDEEGGERHPRLRRRGPGHPLGQLALSPGDEGARERHPHRAGREGGPRPLPHRRRALRRAARAPRTS